MPVFTWPDDLFGAKLGSTRRVLIDSREMKTSLRQEEGGGSGETLR
jgi:hypothetical protein